MTALRQSTLPIIAAVAALAFGSVSLATAGENRAHSLAEKFAGAHLPEDAAPAPASTDPQPNLFNSRDNIPTPSSSNGAPLTTEDVESAFEQRKQADALKRHDELISSIEDRTKAIERLLEKTDDQAWHSEVQSDTPAGTPLTNRNEQAKPQPTAMPRLVTPESPKTTKTIVTEEPEGQTPIVEHQNSDIELADPVVKEPEASPLTTVLEPVDANPATEPETAPAAGENRREIEPPTYALGAPRDVGQGLTKAAEYASRGTVLLIIEPGNKGIRRFKKTADPVLCNRFHCYRSQGPGRSAVRLSRGETLGPFNTLGLRAGSCRSQLTCAFRDIELGTTATAIQPVDLKLMKHDRRKQQAVTVDETCQLRAGRVHCSQPIISKTWKAWIVPETIAIEAGADALQAALDEGLPETPQETIVSQPLAVEPEQ